MLKTLVAPEVLEWTNSITLYNDKLDEQHKELFDLINQIITQERIEPMSEDFAIILSKISDYGLEHFKTEEKLMQDLNYPHLDKHRKEHREYIYHVALFNTNFKSKNYTEPAKVVKFVKGWWYWHIMMQDLHLASYIREKLID